MRAVELKQHLGQIEAYSTALVQGVRIMDERRHMLEPLLNDAAVRDALAEKFRDSYGARAYNHLVPLLAQDLVRDLARLYLDTDSRAGSFPNLIRKASHPPVFSALRTKFSQIPDKWHYGPIEGLTEQQSHEMNEALRLRNHEGYAKSFDEGWKSATDACAQLEVDPVAQKIKTFRDKYHAHLEMAPLGEDPGPFKVSSLGLTYNNILDFADRYRDAVFQLVRVLTGSAHDVEGFSSIHRKCGKDMWRILAGISATVPAGE